MIMNRTSLAVLASTVCLLASARAADPGVQSLFNGRTLEGWEGDASLWSVQDGAITGRTTAETGLKENTFLVWKGGEVADFELRLQYRIVGGNSGIQYRSRVLRQGAKGPVVGGYQADLEAGKNYSGILYEEQGRGILAQRGQMTRIVPTEGGKHRVDVLASLGSTEDIQAGIRSEDWNDYLILARGNRLTHVINGRVTADVIDEDRARAATSGVLALQVHVGPPMTVQFRKVELKRFEAAGGSAAGSAAPASDLERLQGEWVAVAGMSEGASVPREWLDSLRLKFQGSHYDIRWTDGGDTGKVALRAEQMPRHMNIESDGAGPLEGIYEFDGNRVRVAYGVDGAPRPKDFRGAAGASSLVITYQRK